MRRTFDRLLTLLTGACATFAVCIFLVIVAAVVWRGGSEVSWRFLTEQIRLVGAAGGVFYNIIGTLILLATALVVSTPLAFGIALSHGVYMRDPRRRERLMVMLHDKRSALHSFRPIWPDCVCPFPGLGKILAYRRRSARYHDAADGRCGSNRTYLEAAAGLGLSQSQIVWSVILPQSFGGWITGSLLGLARAAGETAPIMFSATIFAGATWPRGIKESPVLSLPYHIFILAQDSFDPAAAAKLWGAALVLLLLVFSLSLIALPLRLRLHEEAHHD